MAINTVVTRGFGNGTYNGTIALVTTHGFAIGEAVAVTTGGGGSLWEKGKKPKKRTYILDNGMKFRGTPAEYARLLERRRGAHEETQTPAPTKAAETPSAAAPSPPDAGTGTPADDRLLPIPALAPPSALGAAVEPEAGVPDELIVAALAKRRMEDEDDIAVLLLAA